MTDEREIFLDCLELPAAERTARLAGVDPALRDRVQRLLAAHDRAESGGDAIGATIEPGLPPSLDGFRIVQRLGEGGMGDVFLATQLEPVRRLVAIKVLKPWLASPDIAARFEAERTALALMAHPSIARILDGGRTPDGRPYIVMEYVPGLPITRYCDERGLGIEARIRLLRAACAAVQHAHFKGVIHRDLKPANILVTEIDGEPVPKVIDFGIAKLVQAPSSASSPWTRVGATLGTPEYMSPEQAAATPIDVDTRTDVWSLGAVLHELLTGMTAARSPERPSRRVLGDARGGEHARCCGLADARALCRRLADELDWIVLRALAGDRSQRYASAAELAADLDRHLAGEAVVARPPSLAYRTRKLVGRHQALAGIVAVAVVAALTFAVMLSRHAGALQVERDRANREAEVARRVTAFTAGLFELANPGRVGTANPSAREILDAGVRRLEAQPDRESPAMRAALLESAGNAYRALGAYPEAERTLDAAVALRRGRAEAEPDALAGALVSRAILDRERGRFDRAEVLARDALGQLSAAGLANAEASRSASVELASILRASSALPEAARLGEAAVAAYERDGVTGSPRYAHALLVLGRIRHAQGRLGDAEGLLERALALHRRLEGDLGEGALEAKNALASALIEAGKSEQAEPLLREVVANLRQIYGDGHTAVGSAWNDLGNALSDIPAKLGEAETAYQTALAIQLRALGPSHPEVATVHNNLGGLYLKTRDWARAEVEHRAAVAGRLATVGPRHPDTAASKMGHALALNRLGRYAEAERLLREAIPVLESSLGRDHWRVANARVPLGVVLTNERRFDEAEAELNGARDGLVRALGADHWRVESARRALADLEAARRER